MEDVLDTDVTVTDNEELVDSDYELACQELLRENRLRDEAEAKRKQEEEERNKKAAAGPPRTPEQKADNLKDYVGATFLYGAGGSLCGTAFDIPTHKVFLDNFLREAGTPTDPVERLLLEQILLAHHALGRLHVRAGTRENQEEITACLTTAARLMGECRRSSLALQTYRDSTVARKSTRSTKVKAKPRRKTAAAPINGHGENGVASSCDTKLGGNMPLNRLKEYLHEEEPALS